MEPIGFMVLKLAVCKEETGVELPELCWMEDTILALETDDETVPPSELATIDEEETVVSDRKVSFQEFKVPVLPVALSSTVMVQIPLAFLPLKILRGLSGL